MNSWPLDSWRSMIAFSAIFSSTNSVHRATVVFTRAGALFDRGDRAVRRRREIRAECHGDYEALIGESVARDAVAHVIVIWEGLTMRFDSVVRWARSCDSCAPGRNEREGCTDDMAVGPQHRMLLRATSRQRRHDRSTTRQSVGPYPLLGES